MEERQPTEEHDRSEQHLNKEVGPRLPFAVVGIGASAGGLEAFIEFFRAQPPDSGLAFVLIQHLPPDRESLIADILSKHTAMPVLQIEDGMEVQPNHVYVIRPGFTPTIKEGRLHLGEPLSRPGNNRPVDDFFKSLAEEQRERSMCVIMSGMGSNGTAGAQAIKAVGGLVIAEEPDCAKFPSMARSVIDAGYADFILRPADIPQALSNFASHIYAARQVSPEELLAKEKQHIGEILAIVRARLRHDFTGYKKPTVLRRIQRRMGIHQIASMADYVGLLRQSPIEATSLKDDLLIHVTGFFRDLEAWEILRQQVIMPLVNERESDSSIRCWVTACASGEEAYSLAILLAEAAESVRKPFDIKIFATDTAERTLSQARNGIYPMGIEAEVSPERLERFFIKDETHYRINNKLREMVVFAPQNVLQDPPFSRLDICTCRNLLIYLEPPLQKRVLSLLHFGIRDGGVLVLGTSETVNGAEELFEAIDKRGRIFRRVGPTRHGLVDFKFPLDRMASEPERFAASTLKASVGQLTNKLLLEKFAPASVTVNRHHEIVFYHGDTNPFLSQPKGEPTRELFELVQPALRAAVRSALEAASAENRVARSRTAHPLTDEMRQLVEVVVTPLDPKLSGGLFVVSFQTWEEPAQPALPQGPGDADPQHVQKELARVREELQSTVEELQTSNEEMKASNEEVMSINEELQSTNEELETSKEELQSMNEELRTVNAQLQAKMEEQEATANDLSSLLTSTAIAVVFLDMHFRIRRFTPTVKDLFELIPGDIGRPITDLAKKFVDPNLTADCQSVLDRLIPSEREVISASNRIYVREIRPYRTNDQHIRGVVITFVEITERKQAEEALRRSEEQLRLLTEGAQDFAMVLLNLDGTIQAWNPGAERLIGYSPQEAIGKNGAMIFVPEEREEGPRKELTEARATGRAIDERWHLRKDGTRFWGSGVMTAVRDAQGQMTGFVKVLRDETARKRAEQELAQSLKSEKTAREQAEEATRLKDHFLATLSHELRTPLSAILMWAKMLADKRLSEAETAEGLAVIARNAEAQRLLLDDLLDTSRIATGKIRLRLGAVNLADTIVSAIESVRFLAGEKSIAIETDLSSSVPALALDGDRIRQVISNLVTNALKFTPEGGRLTITLAARDGGAEIQVSDTGIGIEPAFLPHVFTAFSQADSPTSRSFGGLGLGLAIAKQIVEMHGGTLSAHSEGPGKGASFIVRLPVIASSEAYSADHQVLEADARGNEQIANKSILLVEDDKSSREALARFLTSEGAKVAAVSSAAAAFEVMEKSRPDVIVSDIGLPEQDGYELMQRVRTWEAEKKLPPTPSVALTAYAAKNDSQKARESGYHEHVAKPVDPNHLLRALLRLLSAPR